MKKVGLLHLNPASFGNAAEGLLAACCFTLTNIDALREAARNLSG